MCKDIFLFRFCSNNSFSHLRIPVRCVSDSKKQICPWLNESFVQYLWSGCCNNYDYNSPSGEEDPHNFHLWKEDARLRCLIHKVLTKWSILRNTMLSSVEQQDKKGGLKQDMPDIYVSYLFQLLKWFFLWYFTNLRVTFICEVDKK